MNHCEVMKCQNCVDLGTGSYTCEQRTINIAVSIDRKEQKGLLPLLHSIIKHNRARVNVYIITNSKDTLRETQQIISCLQLPENIKVYYK